MLEVSYAVILTRHADLAAVALESIAAQQPSPEVLLVLNDADDAMRSLATRWADRGARVVHDGADLGAPLGYNVALREARGRFVCTVHEDSDLAPGCAERLQKTLLERPEAAAVGPSVTMPHIETADAALVWSDGATSAVCFEGDADVQAVDYAGSNCLMLRREAVAAVGGFDTRFFPAIYSDVSLSVSLWEAGWAVLCDRRARNTHRAGAMVDPGRGPGRGLRFRQFLLERNRVLFVEKHRAWVEERPLRFDASSALTPGAAEVAEALAGAEARWRAITGPPPAPPARLDVPDDLEAFAVTRRHAFEHEFLGHLIDREASLSAETVRLHEAYGDLFARHVALSSESADVHSAYADLHAELDRVHHAYAELQLLRERELDAGTVGT